MHDGWSMLERSCEEFNKYFNFIFSSCSPSNSQSPLLEIFSRWQSFYLGPRTGKIRCYFSSSFPNHLAVCSTLAQFVQNVFSRWCCGKECPEASLWHREGQLIVCECNEARKGRNAPEERTTMQRTLRPNSQWSRNEQSHWVVERSCELSNHSLFTSSLIHVVFQEIPLQFIVVLWKTHQNSRSYLCSTVYRFRFRTQLARIDGFIMCSAQRWTLNNLNTKWCTL